MNMPRPPSSPAPRGLFTAVAVAWTLLVAATLVALPLALADRLPDPVASHWGPSGEPDGSLPLVASAAVPLAVWVVAAAGGLAAALRRRAFPRAAIRARAAAVLGWGGVFTVGLQIISLGANLDRARWQDASGIGPPLVVVIVLSLAAGALAALAARRGGDDTPPPEAEPPVRPEIGLDPGRRPVWVSSVSAPVLLALGCVMAAAGVLLFAGTLAGQTRRPVEVGLVLAFAGLVVIALSTVSVQAGPEGLRIGFGPLRWPARRVPLDRIERAWVEERSPLDVGGWGYRGLPGRATIMIRGGECLVVAYRSGGRLAISVDDAATGAALLNALLATARP
ncbi:DUF1648 domain-containing protein [Microbispora sp. RL4-1S]|uniref:DUF1648 domain-containing protein n=1 Tax=Microbispora oryzae TaxID=2806554 RepID=A0A940WDD1_9ACTN|nr:DUF1648 domain-containing protein [Microbispora oryzae]MBP2702503.1 DUF1648 domain-containing protein [Microbispora oryzae]